MTDIETLIELLGDINDLRLSELAQRARDLVGKAQNGPPSGEADGTIDAPTWHALLKLQRALDDLEGAHLYFVYGTAAETRVRKAAQRARERQLEGVAAVLTGWSREQWRLFREKYESVVALLSVQEWAGLLVEAGVHAGARGLVHGVAGEALDPKQAGAHLKVYLSTGAES